MMSKKFPTDDVALDATPLSSWRRALPILVFVAGLVGLAVFLFAPVLGADTFLFGTDDNIGGAKFAKSRLPGTFIAAWGDRLLVGSGSMLNLNWNWTMLWLLPVRVYKVWMPAIVWVMGSRFLALLRRGRGGGGAPCSIGALTAFWLGTNFTLLYAGHTPKFGILMFSAVFLYLYERALDSRHPAWAALAGGAFGMMFLEQADVGLFFAVILGPYTLYAFWDRYRFGLKHACRLLVPLFTVALLLAVHPLLGGFRTFVEQDPNAPEKDPQQEWEFITQWSWPPLETIDFVAPGYTGWRSGEPEGPYWGEMGQSAGWTLSEPRGFRNFKLENHYMGAIPCGFLLVALWLAVLRRRQGDATSNEVIVWGVLALIAFLLSCGKYFPLIYKPFSMLPAVSSVRNPNKFLQILQVIMGILAAFGLDAVLGNRRGDWGPSLSKKQRRTLVASAFVLAGLFVFLWMGRAASSSAVIKKLTADGWGAHAEVIAATSSRALAHGSVMALLFAAVAGFFVLRPHAELRRARLVAAWALVLVVAVDAKLLSKHYVFGEDLKAISENPVGKLLADQAGHQRAVLASQQGFYNSWLTDMFPYWDILSLNALHTARLPEDYLRFIQTLNRNPLRWWQLGAGRFVLGPAQLWQQLQADPRTKDSFEIAYAFNVHRTGPHAIEAVQATQETPGQHVVLRYKEALPRYLLVDDWRTESFDDALQTLLKPEFDPKATVLLDPEPEVAPPSQPADPDQTGSVSVVRYRSGQVELKVSTDREAILLISERFDRSWKAWIDGEPVPLLKCNGIFQGVKVRSGLHEVQLKYAPPMGTLTVEFVGLALCLLAGGVLVVGKIRGVREEAG